jgi:hypothetical protein
MKTYNTPRIPRAARVVLASVVAGLSLAACAGQDSATSATSANAPLAAPAAAGDHVPAVSGGGTAERARVPGRPAGAAGSVLIPVEAGTEIIYTAQLTVRARDVSRAEAAAKRIVAGQGGYVASEDAAVDPAHPNRSTAMLVLKIPVGLYPATLDDLATALGTRVSLQQQAQDVTASVADVNSRATSALASIAQLRALLRRAGSVADLLSVQNQINQQESDLESLQAQQRALSRETSFATVSLRLVAVPVAATHKHRGHAAFLRGLSAGWHALRGLGNGLLIALGALIPFVIFIVAAAYLAYRGMRRRLTRRAAPTTTD